MGEIFISSICLLLIISTLLGFYLHKTKHKKLNLINDVAWYVLAAIYTIHTIMFLYSVISIDITFTEIN